MAKNEFKSTDKKGNTIPTKEESMTEHWDNFDLIHLKKVEEAREVLDTTVAQRVSKEDYYKFEELCKENGLKKSVVFRFMFKTFIKNNS